MAKSDGVMLENCYEIYMMNFNGPMRTACSISPGECLLFGLLLAHGCANCSTPLLGCYARVEAFVNFVSCVKSGGAMIQVCSVSRWGENMWFVHPRRRVISLSVCQLRGQAKILKYQRRLLGSRAWVRRSA